MAHKRKRCEWCAVRMTGLRRWWALYCRRCTARQFEYSMGPDLPYRGRVGEVEPYRWRERLPAVVARVYPATVCGPTARRTGR